MRDDLIVGMAGSGGDGIVSAGESLISAAALEGYYAVMTKSFGSQIRGGESSCRVRVSARPVPTPNGTLDVAVAFNWDDFLKFGSELAVDSHTVVVYDSNTGVAPDKLPLGNVSPAAVFSVPIEEIAKKTAGTEMAKNIVVLGLLAGWFTVGRQTMLKGIRKKFAKKGADVVASNEQAFNAGVAYAEAHPLADKLNRKITLPESGGTKKMLTDGNDMCAAAAIFAGCTFFSGYPITPSSEIMQFLDREIWKYGGTLMQAEDEIAGVGAAVGASFAGLKSMTATSGPGMSLKTEILGLASIAELPLVCINVQRGGPSTGLPTKSEQSDLYQAAFSAHGDALRPVLAPVSVADTFGITVEAFNIAEEYQTPVIVLSDQEIAQRKETVNPIDTTAFRTTDRLRPTEAQLTNYKRFKLTPSGISPISQPGMPGGNYLASGIEHNEVGRPSVNGEMHAIMNEKRFKKFDSLKSRRDLFVIEGDPQAAIGLISWGSVSGVAVETMRLAKEEGINVKLLIPKLLFPVVEAVYREFMQSVQSGLVVEQSYQGQLYRLIRMYVDLPESMRSLTKSGANPITSSEVLAQLRLMTKAR